MKSIILKIFLVIVVSVTINTDSFPQTKLDESIENHLDLFKSKRIIGVGESTHNSHQERMFGYSLIKELVKDPAFNIVFIEAHTVSIEKLNDYINSNDTTDIKQFLLKTPYLFWLWKTNEFAQFLTWLKEYNKTTSNKINIFGVYKLPDSLNATSLKKYSNERDSLMAIYIHDILNSRPNSNAILLAHNGHIANTRESKSPYIINTPAGHYLKEFYGDNYFSIGQLFGTGSFNVQIRANFNELETSYVKKDISKLSKQLIPNEKGRVVLTNEKKSLNRNRRMWSYGGIMNTNGQKIHKKGNISKMFDAIIFYDSIYASSNLLINGNYFVKSVHLKSFNKTINKQTLHYKLNYNSTCNSLLEIQFYKDDEFVYSLVDTLQYDHNESLKAINVGDFNNIRSNLYLFEDGKININSFTLFSENKSILLNDLFQLNNNKETPLGRHSKIKLNKEYKNGRFEMYRYTDKIEN